MRYSKYLVWLGLVLLMIGCGGSGKKGSTLSYIVLTPRDSTVVTTAHPTFTFERNTNDTSAALACGSAHTDMHLVKLRVIQVDPQAVDVAVRIEQLMTVPNDCQYSIQFPSLTLEENSAYAWHVGEPDEEMSEDTSWYSFVYTTQVVDSTDTDPYACVSNHVGDWTFVSKVSAWQIRNLSNLSQSSTLQAQAQGDGDSGAAALSSPNIGISQTLNQPIEQGKHYRLKLSLYHEGKEDFQIKALAYNGQLDSLQPDSNTSLIGITGTMTYQGHWVSVSFAPWRANRDFAKLAIVLYSEENHTINAKIDRVCLSEVENGGCGASLDNPGVLPQGFDLNNSAGTETEFEYLEGTVEDLYPEANTSNAEWFLDPNATGPECTTVGEGTLPEGTLATQADMDDNDSNVMTYREEMATWEQEHNMTDIPDQNDSNLSTLAPLSQQDCKGRILDPNRPFSGRDIVYVHGLQKNAIDDLQRSAGNKRFRGRWPDDPVAFYQGGEYYEEAKPYWENHIRRALGDIDHPSNSYLMVTWSSLQHIPFAINAILTQIKDAIDGNNPGVHLSPTAQANNQCFGDNGIVFVTHSTGGMVVSTMFGTMELEKNNPNAKNYVEPALRSKFDAQVGFNAAYGGSRVATAGIMTTHGPLSPVEVWKTVLVDLGIRPIANYYRTIMAFSQKPTFMAIGTLAGPNLSDSQTYMDILYPGFNDGVLSSWVQSASLVQNPRYFTSAIDPQTIAKRFYDLGSPVSKSIGMIKKSFTGVPPSNYLLYSPPTRYYYVTAAFSPSGMLQHETFLGYVTPPMHLPKHYPVIQTSSDHFGNVNKIGLYQPNYYTPAFTSVPNNEETSVVRGDYLYTHGYLSQSFKHLQEQWVKKKTVGFHFVKIIWVLKTKKIFGKTIKFHVPKLTWHYYEFILWKRTYHLLHDYKTKLGMDYMYRYLLRP